MTTLEAELGALFAAPPAPLAEVNAPSGPAARAQTCPGVITGNDVGHAILGQLAELIIDFHYLRHYLAIHALAALRDRDRDKLFFDNLVSNPSGSSNLGSFLRVDKPAAAQTRCSPTCVRGDGTVVSLFAGLALRPDILDLVRAEFYEIKPDNAEGLRAGSDKVRTYHCVLGCLHRNRRRSQVRSRFTPQGSWPGYPRPLPGTTFRPPDNVVLVFPAMAAQGLGARRVIFKSRRAQRGLIVYQFCPQNGQQVPVPQASRAFREQIERWRQALRKAWEEVVPQTIPAIEDAEVAVRRQAEQTQPLPAEHRQTDVFDEINRQLINPKKVVLFFAAIAIAALAVILTRGQVLRYLARLAAPLVAVVREFSLRAAFSGSIAFGLAIARARAAEAQTAAEESRRATSPAARREAANRAARLAAEAARHHREAREAGAKFDQSDARLAAKLAALAAAASAIDPASTTGSDPADKAKLTRTIAQLGAHTAAAAAAQRALRQTLRGREQSAGQAVAAATAAARAVGGRAAPQGGPCGPVSVEINRAFAHWSANPRRSEVTLGSTPTGAHPARQTKLEIANHTRFRVRVWIGEPGCRTVTVAAGAMATVPVAPGRLHRLAARVMNPPPGVPIIPAYGEQTYTAGQVHRMNLGAVQM